MFVQVTRTVFRRFKEIQKGSKKVLQTYSINFQQALSLVDFRRDMSTIMWEFQLSIISMKNPQF